MSTTKKAFLPLLDFGAIAVLYAKQVAFFRTKEPKAKETRGQLMRNDKGGGNIVMPVPIGFERVVDILTNLRFCVGTGDGFRAIHPPELESYINMKKIELCETEVDLILSMSQIYVNYVHEYKDKKSMPPYNFYAYVNRDKGKDIDNGITS